MRRGLLPALALVLVPGCRVGLPSPSVLERDGSTFDHDGAPDQLSTDGPPPPGTWLALTAGSFTQGTPTSEACRNVDEIQRQVVLTRAFEIAAHEVTQAQFESLLGYNPSEHKACGASCPVERVSWSEATAYCNALSALKGLPACYACSGSGASISCSSKAAGSGIYACAGYRLPTEAEWEYAARAGTTTSLYNGELSSCQGQDPLADAIGWYTGTTQGNSTHPVGLKQSNPWGLYDTAGNVWEWVHDWYVSDWSNKPVTDPAGPPSGTLRACRGGGYWDDPEYLRSGRRGSASHDTQEGWLGLRCARSLP